MGQILTRLDPGFVNLLYRFVKLFLHYVTVGKGLMIEILFREREREREGERANNVYVWAKGNGQKHTKNHLLIRYLTKWSIRTQQESLCLLQVFQIGGQMMTMCTHNI